MMTRFLASTIFYALLCVTAWAKNVPEPVSDQFVLIFPANGTVVAGSYFNLGFFDPLIEGVYYTVIMTLNYPPNLILSSQEVFIDGTPSNCSLETFPPGPNPGVIQQMRLPDIGNYTVTVNETIHFYSDVDASKNPPSCSGNVTAQTSILTLPLAVIPAGPGVSETNSQGVVTRTNDPLSVTTDGNGALETLNTVPFIRGPVNTITATWNVAPTGTVYVSLSSARSRTNARVGAWLGLCFVSMLMGGLGLVVL